MHIIKTLDKRMQVWKKLRKNKDLKVVLYLFLLFNSISDLTYILCSDDKFVAAISWEFC